MRFAAELTFSRFAIKAELNFDLISDLRDKHLSSLKNTKTGNFKPDQYIKWFINIPMRKSSKNPKKGFFSLI